MKKRDKYELDKICAYCERSTPLAGGEHVLCEKRGVVSEGFYCRKFVYDPMKRIPKRSPTLIEPEIDLSEGLAEVSEISENSEPILSSAEECESEQSEDGQSDDEAGQKEFPKIDLPKIDDLV